MSKYQFRMLMTSIWFVGSQASGDHLAAVVCTVLFVGYAVGALAAGVKEDRKHG